jgi:DAHL domain
MKAQTYFKAGLTIALMLILLAGFAYLFRQSSLTDGGEQEHLQSSIYNLKQVDANWTAEVLKSYVGLSKDYDALSRSSKHLPHLLSNLSVDLMASANAEAQNTRSELDRLIKEKSLLIEKFKRHNAVSTDRASRNDNDHFQRQHGACQNATTECAKRSD